MGKKNTTGSQDFFNEIYEEESNNLTQSRQWSEMPLSRVQLRETPREQVIPVGRSGTIRRTNNPSQLGSAPTPALSSKARSKKLEKLAKETSEALEMGRVIEAHRKMRELEVGGFDIQEILGDDIVKMICRVSARYEESLKELSGDPRRSEQENIDFGAATQNSRTRAEYCRKASMDLCAEVGDDEAFQESQFDYVVNENTLEVRFTVDFDPCPGFNALQAFVALCEYSLAWCYTENKKDSLPLHQLPLRREAPQLRRHLSGDAFTTMFEAQVAAGGYVSDALPDQYELYERARGSAHNDVYTADFNTPVHVDSLWRVRRRPNLGSSEDNILHVSFVDALDEPLGVLWFSTYTPDEEDADELCGVPIPRPDKHMMRIGYERTVVTIKPFPAEGDAAGGFQLVFLRRKRLFKAAHMFAGRMQAEVKRSWMDFKEFVSSQSGSLNNQMLFGPHRDFYSHVQRHLREMEHLPARDLTWKDISSGIPRDWAERSLADEEIDAIELEDIDGFLEHIEAADEPKAAASPEEFEVELPKSPGKKNQIGLQVDNMNGKTLKILSVKQGGPTENWNQRFPDKVITAGDEVMTVNGEGRGDVKALFTQFMAAMQNQDDKILLRIRKGSLAQTRFQPEEAQVTPTVLSASATPRSTPLTQRSTVAEEACGYSQPKDSQSPQVADPGAVAFALPMAAPEHPAADTGMTRDWGGTWQVQLDKGWVDCSPKEDSIYWSAFRKGQGEVQFFRDGTQYVSDLKKMEQRNQVTGVVRAIRRLSHDSSALLPAVARANGVQIA